MKQTVLLAALVLLTACGYHLKTAVKLDSAYDKTYLQHVVTSSLYQPLTVALSNQGVNLVEKADQATAKIVISKDSLSKQIQSIGANNRVQEYRLDYEVVFSVQFLDRVAIAEQTLELSRDYAFDIGQIAGAQGEEYVLRQQMYEDMAQNIIRVIANQSTTD